ncbi:MAG: Asp-tRNA(Asn)/Glu-tRNA(Gln) amidotransferase subunit GatB [Candidatus Micrarchaeota archaeon]|nr:Asp-tRNA(Asn)/Glu-tRNA(Gln) amidotransferase subunit GatB [Candidatus Micrarchaeota archaeon]
MKIGLEVHVALPTKSKLFCACSTTAEEPNSSICPICLGFPGSKPMLNKAALEYSLDVASALKCVSKPRTSFVRKVYFYPDLPKSYQITQLHDAIGVEGHVELEKKRVRIRRIQLEEDPAKIIREDNYTLVDFNRSGLPLLEIVTEPDIASEEELREFLNELRSILYYLGVDIEKELKVDLNISVSDARVEIKNVTGIRNLVDAARYEIKRQEELVSKKQKIVAETRSYNEKSLKTDASREKESDEEYGFIYEPDLTFYRIAEKKREEPIIASKIAEAISRKYGCSKKTLLELVQFDSKALELLQHAQGKWPIQSIINVIEVLKRYESIKISNEKFAELLEVAKGGHQITDQIIKNVTSGAHVKVTVSDVSPQEVDEEIRKMISANPKIVLEHEKNPKALNFIVGAVAKKLNASPRLVSERLGLFLKKGFKN